MKVKVIKRSEQEKAKTAISVSTSDQPKGVDVRELMVTTVKSWVEDLRQKRGNERLSAKKFWKREFCS